MQYVYVLYPFTTEFSAIHNFLSGRQWLIQFMCPIFISISFRMSILSMEFRDKLEHFLRMNPSK